MKFEVVGIALSIYRVMRIFLFSYMYCLVGIYCYTDIFGFLIIIFCYVETSLKKLLFD